MSINNKSYPSVEEQYLYDTKQITFFGKYFSTCKNKYKLLSIFDETITLVERGMNSYPYCENNLVNHVDTAGEVANILAGVAATLVSNFAAGAAGNALEQRIGRGKVNIRESVTSGLTNAVSGAIYGNDPLKSAKDALIRGAGAGAATAAINHLSNAWDSRKNIRQGNSWNPGSMAGDTGISPYMTKRDSKAGCVTASPVKSNIGYSGGYGYQYKTPGGSQKGRNNNSIVSFGKDVLIGAVMGGLSSVSFYGADKALGSLKGSIRGDKGSSKPENIAYRAVNQKDYDRYSQGLGLEAKNPNGNWGLKEHIINGSGRSSWANDPYIATTTDLSVAQGFNNSGSNLGIAVIDMNKVPSATYKGYEIFPRSNGVEGLPYHYSFWQQEISVHKSVPYEAIKDFIR